ncbi:hypothetical protein MSAN_00771700 [Mycena sanguinolenta]|uniref:Uncharacterized protein n=1 Tax=Mycena sanguinolenta TaxID=230812 RepID=A0A8H6Z6R0_9AGAR|nr:hypothetical protein MSAN_00771700 [Mycena sanguinolenta]
MVSDVSLVPANLANFALQSCLYGVYLVLAVTSICLIIGRNGSSTRRGPSIYWSPIFLGAIGLSLTITAHWILVVNQAFLAFIHSPNSSGPLAFYGNLSEITEVVKTGFLVATVIIGDALIIHRLWIVWGYNKYVIVFPIATLLGLAASGAGITYQFTQYEPGQIVFLTEAGRWITSETAFTLCTHGYSTAFIAWRLWNHGRRAKTIQPYGGRSLRSVLAVIVESAAIYTIWTIFFIATYQSQSNLQFIAVDCWPAITGISCMLIHVRVGMGWAQMEDEKPSTLSGGTQLSSIAVNITRVRHTSMGFDYPMDEVIEEGNKGMV